MMHMRLMIFVFSICLSGCAYIGEYSGGHPYPSGRTSLWSKKGFSDEEVRRFSRTVCASRWAGMHRSSMSRDLLVKIELEKQTCMLEHGFTFKDASWPGMKMCSRGYAELFDVKSYMIFPACQAKYGKYRK